MTAVSDAAETNWDDITVDIETTVISAASDSPEARAYMGALRDCSRIDHRDENAGIGVDKAAQVVIHSPEDRIGISGCFGNDVRLGN